MPHLEVPKPQDEFTELNLMQIKRELSDVRKTCHLALKIVSDLEIRLGLYLPSDT